MGSAGASVPDGPPNFLALPSDLRGAHTSNGSPVRPSSEGSSFSGLFTRVEMGHIVIGCDVEPAVVAGRAQGSAGSEFRCAQRVPRLRLEECLHRPGPQREDELGGYLTALYPLTAEDPPSISRGRRWAVNDSPIVSSLSRC